MRREHGAEEASFAEIVGGFKVGARSRDWLVRWAREGPLSGSARDYFKDDLLAGGTIADLLGSTWGWWEHGGDDSSRAVEGGRDRGGYRAGRAGPCGPAALPLSGERGLGARTRGGASSERGSGRASGDALARGAADAHGAARFGDVGSPCCCHRWATALHVAASPTFAGAAVADRADVAAWRRDDLRAEILSRAAYARAVLALGAGSRGRGSEGWRGALSGGEAAVLVAVGEQGRGSTWLVRGRPWSIGPSRVVGMAFARAVRVRSGGPAGSIIGGRDEGVPALSCGLCGGALGCREEGGLRVGLDVEIARHPLAPSWVAVGGA